MTTQGRPLRAAVLELARPADWETLAQAWRGVQTDLDLPAPAIAVSGRDAFQLWFSFADAIPQAQRLAFVDALRARYLGAIAKVRIGIFAPSSSAELPPRQVDLQQDQWSAFVAPDLAPVFNAEPWLDIPPGPEGQADLLCRLESIKSADLDAAMLRLGAALSLPLPTPVAQTTRSEDAQALRIPRSADLPSASVAIAANLDPKAFLLKVMQDEGVDLALRIEAAKALLPWSEGYPQC